MNILLIGPQGSGKGTQAKFLAQKYGLFYVEIGGLLRDAARANPEIDKLINVEGKLVPDDLAFDIVKNKIEVAAPGKDGILLDGFPRTINQYEMIDSWLKNFGKKIDLVILIDVPEDVSIERLSGRRQCTKCGKIWNLVTSPRPPTENTCECGGQLIQRKDDTPEAIRERLKVYQQTTGKLVELLQEKELLIKIDGKKPIEDVTKDVFTDIEDWRELQGRNDSKE
jgi:adenylate kinase